MKKTVIWIWKDINATSRDINLHLELPKCTTVLVMGIRNEEIFRNIAFSNIKYSIKYWNNEYFIAFETMDFDISGSLRVIFVSVPGSDVFGKILIRRPIPIVSHSLGNHS
jgi:hypothetical protein